METLLRIGLSNAVAALLLAVLVVIVTFVWRRPAVLHALWLLVVVKLVTPPIVWLPEPWAEPGAAAPASRERQRPENGFSDSAPPPVADAPGSPAAEAPEPADPPVLEAVIVPAADPPVADAPGSPVAEARAEPAPGAPAPAAPWWVAALFGLWLAGALGWYALALFRLGRFRRLLRHAAPAPESLRQRAHRLAEKLGLRRRPAVWLAPGRVAPMLWAAGGPPRILFPSELLGRTTVEQQNALLVHELAHLRRRDHWVRWLEFAASGLYWWNPVLWLARRELREAEEHCCDAWVTSTLPDAGKTYAVALLETLDFLSDAPPAAPLLASGVGRVADLKRRLTMIMRGTTPRALTWRGLAAVLGLGALLLPLLPAWARAQTPAPKDQAPVQEQNRFFFTVTAADPATSVDAEKAAAELKELEAMLAKKQAEVAELAAKIQALRATVGKADGGEHRIVVKIDDPNVKYDSIRQMLPKLQESQPGARVIVIDGASGKIIMEADGQSADKRFIRWIGKDGNAVVVPAAPGATAAPQPADADMRIDRLEDRLKKIMDELEQMRRERKPGEAPLHSYDATPLEKLPILGRVFVMPSAEEQAKKLSALRDSLAKSLADLKAKADADRAKGDAELDLARMTLQVTEAHLKEAEAQAERAKALLQKGAGTVVDVNRSGAEVDERRAELAAAQAALAKTAQDKQAREADIQDRLKAAEADRQAAEHRIKQLEERLRNLKDAKGDDPREKP